MLTPCEVAVKCALPSVRAMVATELMNIMIDSLPSDLREKMHQWTMENCTDEREEKWNDAKSGFCIAGGRWPGSRSRPAPFADPKQEAGDRWRSG